MDIMNQFELMANYNQRMNQRLYKATCMLTEIEIKENKGAFFKSIFGTLNHILVGDIIWLNRFFEMSHKPETLAYISRMEQPKSLDTLLYETFNELRSEREKLI